MDGAISNFLIYLFIYLLSSYTFFSIIGLGYKNNQLCRVRVRQHQEFVHIYGQQQGSHSWLAAMTTSDYTNLYNTSQAAAITYCNLTVQKAVA